MGEHGLTTKNHPYETSLQVPLLVRGPGIEPGSRCPGQFGMADLAPTFLDIADAEAGRPQDGRSMLPALLDGEPGYSHYPIQASGWSYEPGLKWWWRGVRSEQFTYVRYHDDFEELYDLEQDPTQLENVATDPRYADVLAEYSERLDGLTDCAADTCWDGGSNDATASCGRGPVTLAPPSREFVRAQGAGTVRAVMGVSAVRALFVAVLSTAVVVSALPAAAAGGSANELQGRGSGRVPVDGATFNDPSSSAAAQNRIIAYLNDMIDQTPAGETIRITQYNLTCGSTVDKIIRAYKRGVNIQIVVNDRVLGNDVSNRGSLPAAAQAARHQHQQAELLRRLQARVPGQGRPAHQVRHHHQGEDQRRSPHQPDLHGVGQHHLRLGNGPAVQRPVRHRRTPRPLPVVQRHLRPAGR